MVGHNIWVHATTPHTSISRVSSPLASAARKLLLSSSLSCSMLSPSASASSTSLSSDSPPAMPSPWPSPSSCRHLFSASTTAAASLGFASAPLSLISLSTCRR
jgi:hypothetical protein